MTLHAMDLSARCISHDLVSNDFRAHRLSFLQKAAAARNIQKESDDGITFVAMISSSVKGGLLIHPCLENKSSLFNGLFLSSHVMLKDGGIGDQDGTCFLNRHLSLINGKEALLLS